MTTREITVVIARSPSDALVATSPDLRGLYVMVREAADMPGQLKLVLEEMHDAAGSPVVATLTDPLSPTQQTWKITPKV